MYSHNFLNMAYTRRNFRRKFYRRRNRRSSGGMWSLAKKAASKVVKYYLNPEYKFLEATNTVTPSNTGSVQPISIITQGDQNTMRSGNEIKVTSILIRATVSKGASATASKLRMILFSDVSSNGAVPALADLLQTADVNAPLNRVNGTRFKIIKDWSYVLDSDDPKKNLYFFKKVQHHIHYLTTDNTNGSLGQGPIYLAFVSDESTNVPQVAYSTRMRFLDN